MLIYDARHLCNEFTGLGRYSAMLLKALLSHNARPDRIELLLDANTDYANVSGFRPIERLLRPDDIVTRIDAPVFGGRHHVKAGGYVNSRRDALYFYPHFDLPLTLRRPALFVVHDLSPLADPAYLYRQRRLRRFGFKTLLGAALARANRGCIAVSQSTRADILRFVSPRHGKRVRVVPNAACLGPDDADYASITALDLPPRFLLYAGDRRPNKNLRKMIAVFRRLRRDHSYPGHFVIAGSRTNTSFDLDAEVAGDESIHLTGPLPAGALAALYARMECLFFLSTYEGFGMPVLEAAGFNRKIVTSNVASLPEVAPASALLLDPHGEAGHLAAEMARYLADPSPIDNSAHCARFSWKRTAEEIFGLAPMPAAA